MVRNLTEVTKYQESKLGCTQRGVNLSDNRLDKCDSTDTRMHVSYLASTKNSGKSTFIPPPHR